MMVIVWFRCWMIWVRVLWIWVFFLREFLRKEKMVGLRMGVLDDMISFLRGWREGVVMVREVVWWVMFEILRFGGVSEL